MEDKTKIIKALEDKITNLELVLNGWFNQELLLQSAGKINQDNLGNAAFMSVIERAVRLAQNGLFDYDGIPEGMKQYDIEKFLFDDGAVAFFKFGGAYYVRPYITDGRVDLRGDPIRVQGTFPDGRHTGWMNVGENVVIIKNDYDGFSTRQIIKPFLLMLTDAWKAYKGALKGALIKWMIITDGDKDVANLKAEWQRLMDTSGEVAFSQVDFAEHIKKFDFYEAFDGAELWNALMNVYDFMFNQIGIFTASKEKKERMVVDEANANRTKIGVILESLYKSRKEAIEQIGKCFSDVKITLGMYINYEQENTEEMPPAPDDGSGKKGEDDENARK